MQIVPEETASTPRRMEKAESSASGEGERGEPGAKGRERQPGKAKESGHQLWLRLRRGFRRAMEKIKNEEMKVAYLSHGLQHLCNITFLHPVRHITHDCLQKVFVVLDAQDSLHLYKEDGFYLSSRRAPVPMTGLLYASQVDHFVAWDHQGALQVLDSSFQVLTEAQSALPIRCCLYSELLNQIVAAGDGNVAVWGFRYGSRSLQCRATVSDGLGPGTTFHHLALDTSGMLPQRCFASCNTGAAAFDISRGTLISFKTKLHSRMITDIVYCEAAGSPVTASRDTTIKVWDETWHIRTVFVGHTGPVIALAIYPQRPHIFSASQDGTIRTWNLDTVDQVDQVHVSEPVEALETPTASCVISVSGASLTLWKINKLYSLYAPLGSPVKRLRCIDLRAVADFPVRVLCACQDATVRVLDAPTGAVLAMLSLHPLQVLDVAYCLPRETLFVLTESGSLLRVNAATDPMVVRKSTASPGRESQPSCLLLYSHMVDPQKAHAAWLEVVANKSDRKAWQKPPLRLQDKNRYVLIIGQEDGLLRVLEWFSARVQCQVEAHGSQRVTALAEYPAQTCIISAGADRTVKMWRVFPYAEESLVPLLCFSCAVPAWHFCCLQETLAVAFQDPETVTYSIVCYNPMEQTRCEHGPEDDPLDDITGLSGCPNLKLFASASRDGSVKVWNSENKLLRHLKLNTLPGSLAFANPQGDLLVGIERHLYLIHHNKYLPSYYKMTLLCAKFLEPIKNTALPISQSSFEVIVQDNVKWLKQDPSLEEAGSPLPGTRQMSTQESKVIRGSQEEAKEWRGLDRRDHDLQQLRVGKVRAAKKVRLTREMREEAFEQYLQIFYKQQPKVEIPKEDVFNADDVLEAIGRCSSISELYGPARSNVFLGAFPQLASLKALHEVLQEAGSPVDKDLAVSSALAVTPLPGAKEPSAYQLQATKEAKGLNASWLSLAAAERAMPAPPSAQERIKGLWPPRRPSWDAPPGAEGPFAEGARRSTEILRAPPLEGRFLETIFGKARMPREKPGRGLSLIFEDEPQTPKTPSSPGSKASSGILNLADAARTGKTLSSEEASIVEGIDGSSKPSRSSLRSRSPMSSENIKGFFPQPAASRDRIQTQTELEGSLLPLPRIPSGFIPNSVVAQQFHGQEYPPSVERLVGAPGAQGEPQSAVRASTAEAPLSQAQDLQLGTEPSREKREKSVSLSWSSIQSSSRVFLTQLDESHYPESETKSEEEISAFYLRFKDADWFKQHFPQGFPPGMGLMELLASLLAALPDADFGTKTRLLEAILTLWEALGPGMSGMVHNTLVGLLNVKRGAPSMQEETEKSFILAALQALLTLDEDSRDLMVELMTYYLQAPPVPRLIIEGLIEETGVRDPHRYFYQEMDSWPVEKDGPKEELRKVCSLWLEGAMQELQEHRAFLALKRKPPRKHLCKLSPQPKVAPPRWRDTRSVHPADAVNYFAEKQLVAELQPLGVPPEMPRDMVMALPRMQKRKAILRLGETNAMLRNRIPEHFYFPYIFPRYLLKGFVPFVKLPLPRINLSPFPPEAERPVSPKTFTARQQSVQKYFIPKFSYADSYP